MMAARIRLKEAERAKRFLIEKNILDFDFLPEQSRGFVYFPLRKDYAGSPPIPRKMGIEIVGKNLKRGNSSKQLKSALEGEFSERELGVMNRSYDVVGNIAILEIPKELKGREKTIANTLINLNKNIKTVLKKKDIHKGEFRTQELSYIAGVRTKETVHKENGCLMKLDVEKVYFSPRLSTERKRIATLVRPGERVLVMFSGCGPYPMVISRNTKAAEIVGIEKNRIAHEYALKNAALNKAGNVNLICGDVRKEVPKLKGKFDRILMPLPKDADTFLDMAFRAAKKGTTIHLYLFLDTDKFEEGKIRVKAIASGNGKKIRFLGLTRCGQYSPTTFRVCLDLQIL